MTRGAQGPLTNNQGVLESLTQDQGAPGPLFNNQGAWASNRQVRGNEAFNWQPGAQGLLTDDQGSRARGPLMQIFNNLYAKSVRNLKVLTNKLPPQALV